MAITDKLTTYEDGSRMDSYTKGVVNIDPVDTPFTSGRPVIKMQNTVHELFTDTLYNATSDHTVVEGSDTAAFWNQAPSSLYFIAETIRTAYKVTRTEYNVISKTGTNPMVRERTKAGLVMKNVYEERAILSTQASGNTDVARQMKGVVSQLASYTYSNASIAFTESQMNNHLVDAWNLGAKIDELYLPMTLKRKFSAFTGAATAINADVKDKRVVSSKNLYESDATELMKVFKSRVLTNFASAASASSPERNIYFGVQGSLVKSGIVGGVTVDEDKPDSLYDTYRGKMQGEWTIMLANSKAGFVAVNEI